MNGLVQGTLGSYANYLDISIMIYAARMFDSKNDTNFN